ncbi:cbb3-type cytochrome oxidase subunit 3 [Aestuariispira insulae]|uniref:Cytochrome c oxidase cbb3-type subunit 4 n=1 Tax=Aestuariispira insulae TaxID=1461337 RepID=A0A3D9HND6_9PROT|nr:CcoQ/FixQ family Cbb3-type cytochrome c oxidase assembly chaperone [Aestuariispira insulae]RED51013.1 cytochrome c oxidase cbb3-type subunit 4 [Aestuariispira insulae]
METIVTFANDIWNLWLMIVFFGIVFWALRPTRKAQNEMAHNAAIPLNDDDLKPGKGA